MDLRNISAGSHTEHQWSYSSSCMFKGGRKHLYYCNWINQSFTINLQHRDQLQWAQLFELCSRWNDYQSCEVHQYDMPQIYIMIKCCFQLQVMCFSSVSRMLSAECHSHQQLWNSLVNSDQMSNFASAVASKAD